MNIIHTLQQRIFARDCKTTTPYRSYLYVILLIATVIIMACSLPNALRPTTPTAIHIQQTLQPSPSTLSATAIIPSQHQYIEKGNDPPYNIQITFPYLEEKQPEYSQFNDEMDRFLTEQISTFKQAAQEAAKSENTETLPTGYSLTITYDTAYISSEVISVLLNIDTFFGEVSLNKIPLATPHPMLTALTFNYDESRNTVLTLADLFEPNSPYLDIISTYCIKELSFQNAHEFPEGSTPTEENYRHWLIQPQGIEIIFDPYQVASYALGRQKVLVPYTELQFILKKEGVITKIRK